MFSDHETWELVMSIYVELKKLLNQEPVKTREMNQFLKHFFKIKLRWIGFLNSIDLELLFFKTELTDEFKSEVIDNTFEKVLTDLEDFPTKSDEQFQRSYYHHFLLRRFDPNYGGTHPDFRLTIPQILLKIREPSFLASFLFEKNFPKAGLDKGSTLMAYQAFFRLKKAEKEKIQTLCTDIANLRKKKNEEEKSKILETFFYYCGFETLAIDLLQKLEDFKELKNLSNPDLVAYSLYTKDLLIIEEKKSIRTPDFHKIIVLSTIFTVFKFLGSSDEWRITQIFIGKLDDYLKPQVTEMVENRRVIFCSNNWFSGFSRWFLETGINFEHKVEGFKLNTWYNKFLEQFMIDSRIRIINWPKFLPDQFRLS